MTDFALKVVPALTLADTHIEISGQAKQPNVGWPELTAAIRAWRRALGDPFWASASPQYTRDYYSRGAPSPIGRTLLGADNAGASLDISPEAIQHSVFDNRKGKDVGHFSGALTDSVSVQTTAEWSGAITAGVSFTVGIEIGAVGAKASASTTYSLSATLGHSVSHTRTVDVGQSSGVDYEVKPGEIDVAVLLLQRGVLRCSVGFHWRYSDLFGWAEREPTHRQDGTLQPPFAVHDRVPVEAILPYLPKATEQIDLNVGYAADDYIAVATVPDEKPSTVENAVDSIVNAARG